jgi:hypothetical protein
MRRVPGLVFIGASLLLPTLAAAPGCVTTGSGERPSGNLMDQTTIGKNRCSEVNPTDKPFIIEWDATDTATFEAMAQRDVVVVRYENCELEVLDACVDSGIPGKYGAYEPVRWSSGSVEGFDINNTMDLYAKLPLGAAELSGSVEAGKSLQLQYFVSGTATSTRPSISQNDFGGNSQCEGATHFVRAYNLGAFVLSEAEHDAESLKLEVKSTAGAGGGRSHEATHLKQGGDLNSCTADTASELSRCKVPIRVTLRELSNDPASEASHKEIAPAPEAKGGNAMEEAALLGQSAARKFQSGDGEGCLLDLDRAQEVDATTEAKMSALRATCEMQAGRCDDGKKRYRLFLEQQAGNLSAEVIDATVSSTAKQHCAGSELKPAERIQKAKSAIGQAKLKKNKATCLREAGAILEQLPKLDKKDQAQGRARTDGLSGVMDAAQCSAKAGDCKEARRLFNAYRKHSGKQGKGGDADEAFSRKFADCR